MNPIAAENERLRERLDRQAAELQRLHGAIKESLGKFNALLDRTEDIVFICDRHGRILDINRAGRHMLGLSPDSTSPKSAFDLFAPRDSVHMAQWMENALETGSYRFEASLLRRDGGPLPVEILSRAVEYPAGTAVLSIARDLSQARCRESEQVSRSTRLMTLCRLAQDINATLSTDTLARKAMEAMSSCVEADVCMLFLREGADLVLKGQHPATAVSHAEQGPVHRLGECLCGLAVSEGKPQYSSDIHSDPRCVRNECKEAGFESFAAVPLKSDSAILGLIGLGSRTRRDFAPDAAFIETIANGVAVALRNAVLYEETQESARELQRKLREIEEREQENQRLQDQLAQSQKMEAIGTLAGGIAHDFNNILTSIMGFTELVLYHFPPESPFYEDLNSVLDAARRAKELIGQILTFSRQDEPEYHLLMPGPVVKETLKLLRVSLPSTIDIRDRIDCDAGPVLANATKIQQIVMNLCTNAAHAMEDQGGGVLELGLREIPPSPDHKVGPWVEISVKDTGQGIPEEIRDRIFDPYFTTKKKGQGTGLGLAVVHGIVQGCHGHLSVESKTGAGSTFRVRFPRSDGEVISPSGPSLDPPFPGKASILFVDDEPPIAQVCRRLLTAMGFRVTAMTDSRDAMELFRKNPNSYDLLITDQVMPSMTGMELIREVRKIREDIPVVLCTGYSEKTYDEEIRDLGIGDFLLKPLNMEKLLGSIHRVLRNP